jgi:RNA polymerase sigma factor (TIGR02999 family)
MDFLSSGSKSAPDLSGDVTLLLERMGAGDSHARSELFDTLYPELKRMARLRMSKEHPDHTLQATALVNEFFLEIARSNKLSWRNRSHFLAVASVAMRRFLIDYSRERKSNRRGGRITKLSLDGFDHGEDRLNPAVNNGVDPLLLSEVLEKLALEEPRMAQVVDMRCFGGLTHAEIAEVLGIDERTAKRDWQVARAWLASRLKNLQ